MSLKSLVRGLTIGAAVGIAAGLMLAPASGDKTRKKFVKGSGKLKKKVISYVEDSVGALRDQFNEKIDGIAKHGKETINHVSDRVKV